MRHRCSQALLGLLLCIAGLRGENSLPTTGAETSTFSNPSDLTPTIATLESTTNDTQAKERIATVSASGATVTPPGPSTSSTALPTAQHEPSSSEFSTSNSSTSPVPNTGVSSTAGPNSSVITPQVSQGPPTTNSTGSPTSNSTAVTTNPTNTTATLIQNSESPSSPESFSPKTGPTQTLGTTVTAATSPTIVNTNTEVPHPTETVSTVSQGPAVDMEKTPTTTTKNASQTTATLDMKEGPTALSSGSVAAITVTVIFFVLLIFGGAAYLKIRHSSYGRLVDDHDYGSWGNYNNPLYDDS